MQDTFVLIFLLQFIRKPSVLPFASHQEVLQTGGFRLLRCDMKRCSGCKEWKSLDKFNKDNSRKDGCSRRCKECNKEVVRQWRIDNPGKITDSFKAYFHNWYLANKERMLEYNRMWVKSNPEKKRAKDRNRSANKRGAFGKMTLREWEELKEKYNYTCLCCKDR